tara:strand:+ start:359 stop:577 length:219 start_codon:yes stop_codon:yes gene_type:complete
VLREKNLLGKEKILLKLENKLMDDYLIDDIRWSSDDGGTVIEVFVHPKDAKRLRSNLKSLWYKYPTIVISQM